MRRIPEQVRKNSQTTRKSQEAEKKTSRAPSESIAPECASAAASEASRALGFAVSAQSGGVLLSGGNQLLLSIMQHSRENAPETAVDAEFSEISPENEFHADVTAAEAPVPEFTGQMVGMTDLASIT